MFCIAAFIVFAVLAIFSASFRPLAAKAWHCVLRRITFRPCDISFGEEMKGKLVGKLIFTHPRLARFINRWIDWLSFVFVVLSLWSLLYVANAGLNLWVYDTCNPSNVESCSLSGEACGVDQASIGLGDALREGKILTWASNPFVHFFQTVSRIPDRLRHWDPAEYLGPTSTTYAPLDPAKPYALEVLDPSCHFCRKLFGNMKQVGFEKSHNLSYLLYPIPVGGTGATKFPHSPLIASYVEAVKHMPLSRQGTTVNPDWQLLEKVFGTKPDGTDWQSYFNLAATADDVRGTLRQFLSEMGYSASQIATIETIAASSDVADALKQQATIVEQQLRTIKIPTLLVGGRRFDRVVDPDALSALH